MSILTTINAGDNISTSRTDINTNFSNLNADKVETTVLDTDTTLAANSDLKVATQKAVRAYVDSGGQQNASETVRGLVEEGTDAEVTAGTATGATGAKLFLTPAKLLTYLATFFASSVRVSMPAAGAIAANDAVRVLVSPAILATVASGTRTTTTASLTSLWDGSWFFGGGFFGATATAGANTTFRSNAGGSITMDGAAVSDAGNYASLIATHASSGTSMMAAHMKPNGTIALNAVTAISGTSTALSTSVTVTGSNIGLWVSIFNQSATEADVTSVTYGGIAMAKVGSQISAAGAAYNDYLYFLLVTAGTANVIINSTSNVLKQGAAVSYTGVGAIVASGDNAGKIVKTTAKVAEGANNFIGFAPSSIVAQASGNVTVQGSVGGLTLTAGTVYYLSDTNGLLSTSAGTVPKTIGFSYSTTALIIKNA